MTQNFDIKIIPKDGLRPFEPQREMPLMGINTWGLGYYFAQGWVDPIYLRTNEFLWDEGQPGENSFGVALIPDTVKNLLNNIKVCLSPRSRFFGGDLDSKLEFNRYKMVSEGTGNDYPDMTWVHTDHIEPVVTIGDLLTITTPGGSSWEDRYGIYDDEENTSTKDLFTVGGTNGIFIEEDGHFYLGVDSGGGGWYTLEATAKQPEIDLMVGLGEITGFVCGSESFSNVRIIMYDKYDAVIFDEENIIGEQAYYFDTSLTDGNYISRIVYMIESYH